MFSKNSFLRLIIISLVLLSFPVLALAQPAIDVKPALDRTVNYLSAYEKLSSKSLSLWNYAALAAAEHKLTDTRIKHVIFEQMPRPQNQSTAENGLWIISLLVAGENPYNYQGQNHVQKIQSAQLPDGKFADYLDGNGEGDNGEQILVSTHVWAVLALHSAGAEIKNTAKAREWLIAQQHDDGSFNWCVSEKKDDVDSTGMALMALGALGEKKDSPVVQKAYAYLKGVQENDGGFSSWGAANAESCCMVIEGLTAVGIEPTEMNKPGGNPVSALLSYQLPNGSFEHIKATGANEIATYQALLALSDEYYGKSFYQRLAEKSKEKYGETVSAMRKIQFKVGAKDYELQVNGQIQVEKADVAPFVLNDRTYVAIRYLALALGIPETGILWSPSDQTVTLNNNGITVKLAVGSNIIYVNSTAQSSMDVTPVIREGRTCLPARYVAEAFDCQVAWDATKQTVIITQ